MKKLINNQLIIYKTPKRSVSVEVLYSDNNVWLSQKQISQLFDTSTQNITMHLRNVYNSGEVEKISTCKDYLQVGYEGDRKVSRRTKVYSLEAVIAVGYRVNSTLGTEFRKWATNVLRNYIHKGYALNSDRLKYGSRLSSNYFDELYEEILDIRTSERIVYQKITDIYATSIDYSPSAVETQNFFSTVQNKLHFAIAGLTAAEIILNRSDSKKENMGLTSWRRSPNGKIMPSDVVIAKNYLSKAEIKNLNKITNMYLDYAEIQAIKRNPMTMKDWISKLDAFLKFNAQEILYNFGKVKSEVAKTLALKEYKKFKKIQDKSYLSDFDLKVEKFLSSKDQ